MNLKTKKCVNENRRKIKKGMFEYKVKEHTLKR